MRISVVHDNGTRSLHRHACIAALSLAFFTGFMCSGARADQVTPLDNWLEQVDLASDTAWQLSIDASTNWRSIKVPCGGWNSDQQSPLIDRYYGVSDYVTYVRSITVPNVTSGQVTKLLFGAVNYGADVYLNDVLVTNHAGPMMPFEADITDIVAPGNTYALKVKAYHRRHYAGHVPVGFDYELGIDRDNYSAKFAYGITKYVKLAVYPQISIKDVFVRPSVSSNSLSYDVWIQNHSSTQKTVSILGALSSWNGDTWAYPGLPATPVIVAGNSVQKVTVGPVTWGLGSSSYWWPNLPFSENYAAKLHYLVLTLQEGGTTWNIKTQRFGFCEYTEGANYYMVNGVRMNNVSDGTTESGMSEYDCYSVSPAFLPPTGPGTGAPETWKRYMRIGINANRICQSTPTEYIMQAADEVGFMLVPETGIRGYEDQAWDDIYLPQAERELAIVCRNHPSVVRYSLSNEWGTDVRLLNAILPEDSTRPLVYEVNGGSFERVEGIGGHAYVMLHYAGYPTPATFICGMGEFAWATDGIAEFATTGRNMRLNDLAYFAGWDWINYWPNFLQGMSHAKHAWAPNNHADRSDGVDGWNSDIIRYTQRSLATHLIMDSGIEAANASYVAGWPQNVPTYSAGANISRTISVFNGGLSGSNLRIDWEGRWDAPGGTLAASGTTGDFTLQPGFHTNKMISFNAPSNKVDRTLYMVMYSRLDGMVRYVEDRIHFNITGDGVTPPVDGTISINDNTTGTGSNQFEYVGTWSYGGPQSGAYQSDNHWSLISNSYCNVRFMGTQIKWYAARGPNFAIAGASIDGGVETDVDQYAASRTDDVLLYDSGTLPYGSHMLTMRVTGRKNPLSSDYYISADRADIVAAHQLPGWGAMIYEAENAIALGGSQTFSDSSASAGAAVAMSNTGDGIEFDGVSAGTNLTFYYHSPNTGSVSLYRNGIHAQDICFTPTGNWSGSYYPLCVNTRTLPGDTLTLQLDAGDSPLNVDRITINSALMLMIASLQTADGTNKCLQASFSSISGKVYRVWGSTNLLLDVWTNAPYATSQIGNISCAPVTSGAGTVTIYMTPSATSQFYRISED